MENLPQLCLKWNNFPLTVSSSLESLRSGGDLVDTVLWCEGRQFKAHRVVLSACSNYFKQIFKQIPSTSIPVAVVLSNVPHQDVESVLTFMYSGEVSIYESQLGSFLKTAESLQVKGLRPDLNPPPSPTLSSSSSASRTGRITETQFLAAALQRPKPSLHHNTPPPTIPLPSQSAFPPVLMAAGPTLPSIDLGKAISNFTQNDTDANQNRKRKLTDLREDSTPPSEEPEDVKDHKNLVLVDPSGASGARPPSQNSNQDNDPLRDSPGQASVSRPQSIQGKGERPWNARIPFCPHCREDCHNISALKYHVKTVHSEPAGCLCCCYCPAVFFQPADYKHHALEEHGVKHT